MSAVFRGGAAAQVLGYASTPQSAFPSDNIMVSPDEAATGDSDGATVLPERLQRATVNLNTREAPGTVIIDTGNTTLYYVLGQGRAIRYGVGVGRQGFTWAGTQTISPESRMAGLASAGRDDRAAALFAALHGGRPRQSARRARNVSRQ